MKVYLIWNEYKGFYFSANHPTEEPYWYPNCFKSWESAEASLKKYLKNYTLENKKELKTKRTYIFHRIGNNPYEDYEVKYIIVERNMK